MADDEDGGRDRTVREFVAEFRGLSGTAKQKKVLEATGLGRASLSALRNGDGLDAGLVANLLIAMQEQSRPVKPAQLGVIGEAHLRQRFAAAGCEMESFDYKRVVGCTDGIPWVIETAFGWCPDASQRRLVTGVNWSPGIINPFRVLGRFGASLDTILSQAARRRGRARDPGPAHGVPARRVPRPRQVGCRGGLTMDSKAIIGAVQGVTAKWTKQRKAEERHAAAARNRRWDVMTYRRSITIKEAAYEVMEAAYLKASASDRCRRRRGR